MGSATFLSDSTTHSDIWVEVIVPAPIPKLFTYRMAAQWHAWAQPGVRVIVPFGLKKVYTGLIVRTLSAAEAPSHAVKEVLEVLDTERPSVNARQLRFFQWVWDYYMAHPGEVLNAALPAGLRLSSESYIQLNPDWEGDATGLKERDLELISWLRDRESLSYAEVGQFLNIKSVYAVLKNLGERGIILTFEQVKDRYTPKTRQVIALAEKYQNDPESLGAVLDSLGKAPKQADLLLALLKQLGSDASLNGLSGWVDKKKLLAEGQDTALSALLKKGIIESHSQRVSRFPPQEGEEGTLPQLADFQQTALDQIRQFHQQGQEVLLYGVTGSGKTEVYIRLMEQVLEKGQQVLVLLPEIALTAQIVGRLQRALGDVLGVYHSRFSDNERVEVWQGLQSGRFKAVVGVRSAVFLPFDNLGLIIIDEEHESSYKQYEPAPRYQARDSALVLARLHGAQVVLGSATPSLEAWHQCREGKWGLVELNQRFGEAQLPQIELIDLKAARKQESLKKEFTPELLDSLAAEVAQGRQVILFQNRRGYAAWLSCQTCGWIPMCPNCDVSLTKHQRAGEIRCHYCGYKEKVPVQCPACGAVQIKNVGFGTEKLEEDLQVLLPELRVERMDLDTTRGKTAYQDLIQRFEAGGIDVLIGTQMVSKGLDFDRVSLVGVFDVDRMLHFPDFRAAERTFQLVTQVAGRAGRRNHSGRVLIQTASPEHPVLQGVAQHQYTAFLEAEREERARFGYPPYVRLIRITGLHPEKSQVERSCAALARALGKGLGASRVLGPEFPPIERLRNNYQMDIWLKLESGQIDPRKAKEFIRAELLILATSEEHKRVYFKIDVDPS